MYKSLLEKQFQIDFNVNEIPIENNLFVTSNSSKDSRYWARNKADIVCYKDILLVRTNNEKLTEELQSTFSNTNSEWFLEMKNVNKLSSILEKYNLKIERLAPFFIPNKLIIADNLDLPIKFFNQLDILDFKSNPNITEAFCYSNEDPDQLGIGYYNNSELVAIYGANKNGKYTWEIGIEILDNTFRGKGIATTLVKLLIAKIQSENSEIIPVYSTSFSHVSSMNVAISAGLKLGWTEIIISENNSL
ncbi:GNAT family N-acetyltransferase [Vagococcus carniphilus]|uniref:GNAT family N-acetyltransferase n=1 Tax=Vagococcus carniphilus TaxID=218144 RepID=UPI003BAA97E8